jgi:glycosyltransferase involved in cell wall biosynthesis
LNILFILPEYYPHSGGGISTYYQHYIDVLKPHCKRIKVIVGSGYVQGNDKFNHNGIEVEYLDPQLYKQQLEKFIKLDLLPEYKNNIAAAWAMWHQTQAADGFDIIECTDFGLGVTPWVIHHNKPVIIRMHGSAGQIALHENDNDSGLAIDANMQADIALLPLCDLILTHSQLNRDFWASFFPVTKINYIKPIYQAVINKPQPFTNRDNQGLVTARIQKWKGPAELCKAMQLLGSNTIVKWVGRDMAYNKTTSTAEFLSAQYPDIWDKRILTSTSKPNSEIQTLQQHAKFGLVPSLWDMFNFSCLEFMAVGTPVICADGAGVSALIEHGKNGYKYNATDPTALAACIEAVLSLKQKDYERIALAGQQTIDDLLSAKALVPLYMKHYTALITGFKPVAVNVFLSSIYSPSDMTHSIADILDKQPLRKLVNYIKNKALRKMKKK